MRVGPIEYKIHPDSGLLYVWAEGHLRSSDILAYLQAVAADPDFESGLRVLTDLRRVDHYDLNPDDIRTVAEANAGLNAAAPPGRRLALVSPKDAVYGLLRMFQALSEGQDLDVRAFRTIDEAVAWLEVPTDLVAP